MHRYVVARTVDIPEGGRLIVDVAGREVGVFRRKGEFFAILNHCPHLGGPLCKGDIVTEISARVPGEVRGDPSRVFITCPWHNWEFDIATGQSYWNPKGAKARPVPLSVQTGEALLEGELTQGSGRVPGPYNAETLSVSVEENYVVLQLPPSRKASA